MANVSLTVCLFASEIEQEVELIGLPLLQGPAWIHTCK